VEEISTQLETMEKSMNDSFETLKNSENSQLEIDKLTQIKGKLEELSKETKNPETNFEEILNRYFEAQKELNEMEMPKVGAFVCANAHDVNQIMHVNIASIQELKKSFDANLTHLGPILNVKLEGQLSRMTAAIVIAIDEMTNRIIIPIKSVTENKKIEELWGMTNELKERAIQIEDNVKSMKNMMEKQRTVAGVNAEKVDKQLTIVKDKVETISEEIKEERKLVSSRKNKKSPNDPSSSPSSDEERDKKKIVFDTKRKAKKYILIHPDAARNEVGGA
jgi:hypothetical protein